MGNQKNFKLSIELVPETCWHNNLRSLLPKEKWGVLRKKVYADYKNRCGICGNTGRLEAHEMWQYDDENHIQKLIGIIALCSLCHGVSHFGRSETVASPAWRERLIAHFMKINGATRGEFEAHRQEAYKIFEERSQHSWKLSLGETDMSSEI